MESSALASELVVAAIDFLDPLRAGTGVDEDALGKLCEMLRLCAQEWRDADVIPREAANLFVDLVPGIHATLWLYQDTGERNSITQAADTIQNLVRACVSLESTSPEIGS